MPPEQRSELLRAWYLALLERLGPSRWWPGESPFEVAVGAVLVQNTAWRNVEKALASLKAKKALDPASLLRMPEAELHEALRPSGYFRLKAGRLRNLLAYFAEHAGWDKAPGNLALSFLKRKSTERLRRELLAVKGIGAETADAVLLYALDRPSFVVDAYTRRIFSRHGLVPPDIAYEDLREFFMRALPEDRALYNEYHALIVRLGNAFCLKSRPRCAECPLGVFMDHAPL
ncbi:MAG: endonuclease III domain-containing protein [Desulfovibrio sp.]|nr:endonuclease III domain-containing protein [Desulfovibrio sp.]